MAGVRIRPRRPRPSSEVARNPKPFIGQEETGHPLSENGQGTTNTKSQSRYCFQLHNLTVVRVVPYCPTSYYASRLSPLLIARQGARHTT